MFPDTQSEMDGWMKVLSGVIDRLKNPNAGASKPAASAGASAGAGATSAPRPAQPVVEAPTRIEVEEKSEEENTGAGFRATPGGGGLVRQRLDDAKNAIGFLQQDDSKVLEFWQIWSESIPPQVRTSSYQTLSHALTIELILGRRCRW